VTRLAVDLGQFGLEVGADIPRGLFQPYWVAAGDDRVLVLGHEDPVGGQRGNAVPACAGVDCQWP
jgi:hypothetical protein